MTRIFLLKVKLLALSLDQVEPHALYQIRPMTTDDKEMRCHLLAIYDGASEELVEAIEIKNFDLLRFIHQFDVCPETDPEMLDRYGVGPDDVEFLVATLGTSVEFQFSQFAYFIEAAKKH